MHEAYTRTLRDYKAELRWVRELGWSDEQLDQVQVHEQATSNDEFLNLANFAATSLDVFAPEPAAPTSAAVSNVRNLYVYRRETPAPLYEALQQLLERGGPSAYERGVIGERGEAEDFPPRQ